MNVIPQLFYDLIARIIPSIGILFIVFLAVVPNIQIEGINELYDRYISFFSLWNMLLLLSILYIVAIILKTPAEVLANGKFLRRTFFDKPLSIEEGRLSSAEASTKFATIRYKIPDEGFRLLKMLAEVRLCEMLLLGLLVGIVVNVSFIVFTQKHIVYRVILLVCFLLSVKSLLSLKKSIKSGFVSSIELISKKENY